MQIKVCEVNGSEIVGATCYDTNDFMSGRKHLRRVLCHFRAGNRMVLVMDLSMLFSLEGTLEAPVSIFSISKPDAAKPYLVFALLRPEDQSRRQKLEAIRAVMDVPCDLEGFPDDPQPAKQGKSPLVVFAWREILPEQWMLYSLGAMIHMAAILLTEVLTEEGDATVFSAE